MKRLELAVEAVILASRWLLVIFYLGLALALGVYAISFGVKLWEFIRGVLSFDEAEAILKMLGLIDAALVASLIVMVIISGYENFVSRFDDADVHWLGQIDTGSLKIKVASTIVAISSIHLLQVFLKVESYPETAVFWQVVIHMVFVVGAVLLGLQDWIGRQGKEAGKVK